MAEAKTKPAAQKAAPAAKPAAVKKSTATKTTATAKPAAEKKAPAAKKAAAPAWNPGNEERYNMIQVAAYYLAERDSFAGNPIEYWAAAEVQISGMLPKK